MIEFTKKCNKQSLNN